MTIKDIMKYVESEYRIINNTPCEICGSDYIAEELDFDFKDGLPYDVCSCVCPNCGHEKIFEFYAPFIDEKNFKKTKKRMN